MFEYIERRLVSGFKLEFGIDWIEFLILEPNPNDPLNKEAANMLVKDKNQFERNITTSMRGGYISLVHYDRVI